MPNHVYNSLKITGQKKALKKFAHENADPKNKEQSLNFEAIAPCPTFFLNPDDGKIFSLRYGKQKLPVERWYEWRLRHWGTKWNAYDIDEEHDTNSTKPYLLYRFLTAWSPPQTWLEEAGQWYPELTFQMCFEEEANSYPKGTFRMEKGRFKELKGCRIK